MEKYAELSNKLEEQKINILIDNLNSAIARSEMEKINELYHKVQAWNSNVDKLIGAKIALDAQFHYLRLPSPAIFSIIYDGEDRSWKFNINS